MFELVMGLSRSIRHVEDLLAYQGADRPAVERVAAIEVFASPNGSNVFPLSGLSC